MNKKATGLKNLSKFSEITLFECRGENMSKHKTINNFISRQAVNKNMNTQQMMLNENFMTLTRQQKFNEQQLLKSHKMKKQNICCCRMQKNK